MKLNTIENRQAESLVINSRIASLKLFSQSEILEQIGRARLSMLLTSFGEDLNAAGIDLPLAEEGAALCFSTLASIFSDAHSLPQRLYSAALTLEAAASPENDARLDETIRRRLPCVSLNRKCSLDCALELWFACPDELPQFVAPLSNFQTPEPQNSDSASGSETHGTHDHSGSLMALPAGKLLLDDLTSVVTRYVVLPKHAAEALALWIVHTYAFELRDVSVYIGIESPEKRCGKTTLLTVLSELAHKAITAANISPSAFFHVIENDRPTLLIDEADTFLNANEPLRGILNSGYKKKTAYVLRTVPVPKPDDTDDDEPGESGVGSTPPSVHGTGHSVMALSRPPSLQHSSAPSLHLSGTARYSTWCPKAIATIDKLPETLADRCILIRMQRKVEGEPCERLRDFGAKPLQDRCVQFVKEHSVEIAKAMPPMPQSLSDRAVEIWEPLIVLADIAGGDWPERARQAAVALAAGAQQTNPIGCLLLDIFISFFLTKADRLLTRELIEHLNGMGDRPWKEIRQGNAVTDRWLAQQLRPYGIRARTMRIGGVVTRGYLSEDFRETFKRYIPRAELQALKGDAEPQENKP